MAEAIQYGLSLDPAQLAELQRVLAGTPKAIPTVIMRALNRGMDAAFGRVKTAITSELNLRPSDIAGGSGTKGRVSKRPAKATHLQALVQVSGKRIALVYFGARTLFGRFKRGEAMSLRRIARKTGRKPAGVTYQIGRSEGRKYIEQAFIAGGKVGGDAEAATTTDRVFRRVGASRLPIMELFGPSIPHVATRHRSLKSALEVDVSAVIAKRLQSQIELALQKSGKEPPDA